MQKLGVRDRIIETASDLFYNQGYNQTGINQIIAEAEVAKSSMYQHFRSKEDIAVVYLQQRHNMWMGWLSDFVTNKNGKQKIFGAFDFIDTWLKEVKFRGCGFQNIITDLPKDHDRIADQVLLHKNELKKWIHNVLKEESTYKSRSEALSSEIIVLVEGAIILSQIQKDPWPIISARNVCEKILI